MRALKGSWLREEICPTLWQVEVWRLIAHIFVLGKSCQCRCPRRVSSSCPSWMGVKRLRSHAGTMKMELTLGVHCNGACSSCSPRAGLILYSRKGVKAAGKTGIDGRWGGGMSRPMTWRNLRRNGEEEDTWGGGGCGGKKWGMLTEGRQTWREEKMEKYRDESGETVLYGRGTERGKEWEAEKEVRSIDSTSGMHFCLSVYKSTPAYSSLQHDRGGTETMTKSTAEYKSVKSASATDQRMYGRGVVCGFWQAWLQQP